LNILDFVDEQGTPVRLVRDQEDARWVQIFEDGILVAQVDLDWQGGDVTHLQYTDAPSSYWFVATADTAPEIVSTGGGGGGGGCPPEGCVYIESAPSETCDSGVDRSADSEVTIQSDCGTERSVAAAASGTAVASGAIAVATAKLPGINIWSARQFAVTTAAAAGAGFAYVVCLLM
jgi:hypothetical protein